MNTKAPATQPTMISIRREDPPDLWLHTEGNGAGVEDDADGPDGPDGADVGAGVVPAGQGPLGASLGRQVLFVVSNLQYRWHVPSDIPLPIGSAGERHFCKLSHFSQSVQHVPGVMHWRTVGEDVGAGVGGAGVARGVGGRVGARVTTVHAGPSVVTPDTQDPE